MKSLVIGDIAAATHSDEFQGCVPPATLAGKAMAPRNQRKDHFDGRRLLPIIARINLEELIQLVQDKRSLSHVAVAGSLVVAAIH